MEAEKPDSRLTAVIDLLIVVAVLVIVKQSVLPYSIVYAGPASTFTAMGVATFLLYRRGFSWADLGLRWPESWWRTARLTVLIFIGFLATVMVFQAIAGLFFDELGTSGRFDAVQGNLGAYLIIMALVWTHSAFFEELLFRAFIITKSGDAMGGTRVASLIAVLLAAIFFGYRHYYYQGMYGAVVTGGIGLFFGLIYLKIGRRNIIPLVLVHGIVNSIGQTERFLS